MDSEYRRLVNLVADFIAKVVTELPRDVLKALKHAYSVEESPRVKAVYEAYFKNLELARAKRRPICQDTGILMFFVKAGTRFPLIDFVHDALIDATKVATAAVPLRPNAVNPFTGVNSGDNTGAEIPFIHVELVPGGESLEVALYVAGGGSSLPGASRVFTPAEGLKAVKRFVVDTVAEYGLYACPPLIVGVGVGATAEIAALLSKKALLREIGVRSTNPDAARLEEELEKGLNSLNIGAQGLGGRVTVLGVSVEYSHRHPATLATGVSIGCWAHRRGLLIIQPDLRPETPYYG